MIRHVVMFTLRAEQEAQRRADAAELERALLALEPVVPGVRAMQVGIDDSAAPGHRDMVLISDHDSPEALAEYQRHPEHLRVLELVAALAAEKSVVDFALDPVE
ncbi:Dabb family protein [Gulosibacter sp. 10]|uniref:Dabb family protein n=1 Tax=Gulosibacter sp. 10 TaxID=1255570 RepID=UPI00097F15B5|nr:Dabb family protein [Gulosibacter sp. 10]SJM63895.1 Stress responsive alpha-beta barrel domain protein Dabb [Gulosibacter sp. 10]